MDGTRQPTKDGSKVRKARLRALLEVKELAEKAGVSVMTVWRAEHGIPIGELSEGKLARALGVADPAELFAKVEEVAS